MEVKTQEIIRYIDLRFKEQDLIELKDEIEIITNYFKSQRYESEKKINENIKKLREFQEVIHSALHEIKS